ncbi:MAG: TetR/AcrR family transcriptional regulator [Deltaproteobacteria bacterium]|nr:MAG: TetR/AcrR family transcriptional regulator [Deltaproteobacteria bacterium]
MSRDKKRRRRPVQERSKVTVDALIEATAQVLVAEGYARATTNRIAKRAGVSIGTLYQYFRDKDALIEALTERHLRSLVQVAAGPLTGATDLPIPELTRRIVDALIEMHRTDPALHQVLATQAPVDLIQRLRRATEQILSADMAARHERGENKVVDAPLSAFLVVCLIDEAIRSAILDRPELLEGDRLAHGLCQAVVRMVGAQEGS